MTFVLQRGKEAQRGGYLAQSHTTWEWQSQDLCISSQPPFEVFITLCSVSFEGQRNLMVHIKMLIICFVFYASRLPYGLREAGMGFSLKTLSGEGHCWVPTGSGA